MALDDISIIAARLLIAVGVAGALYVAVHTFAPNWMNMTANAALNTVNQYIPLP